jgi:hypothetical protein
VVGRRCPGKILQPLNETSPALFFIAIARGEARNRRAIASIAFLSGHFCALEKAEFSTSVHKAGEVIRLF